MSEMKHIVLAGGGTAGHVNPLLSVADAIRRDEPDACISVIGTTQGLERTLVPQAGYELDSIDKLPFPRRLSVDVLRFPGRWLAEKHKVESIMRRRHAQVVVGFGGYASAPAYSVAHRLGIPIAIHEQNARAGMANKLGARWARYVATAFAQTGLKASVDVPVERIGLPLRPAIASLCDDFDHDRAAARRRCACSLGLDPDRKVIVVTGGSLGAVSVNRAMADSADRLLSHAQIIHLTGKGKIDEVRSLVGARAGDASLNDLDPEHAGQGDYHVAEYLERIDLAFGCADLVVCRSGAGSVCELSALGIPAVYVPLPIGNGEQRFNALPVVEAGGAIMVTNQDFTRQWVESAIPALVQDDDRLRRLGDCAWSYGIRDAADVMARHVLGLIP
ncbi:MAG: UDP-N-acetylglucosamine--N-acetylmuramyl-(pentapeptide) pyrophosphoryl-undecaprenol N-acetylglucosamine transferase [Bifidobacterium sp.]|jgi:UDP-N-acetylglucosamine--N-acetylmuramyl-(pentapeptide) pyrophosphoryl-undecaprenol N-acetylglucosamine transferase|nr:UDP-N-acetylglucosamine--N-acetylmuramyl-(pentapeptide) pyrophosphoryl-undecaprenol N-acetylglucosamine transferase [Bifidobacterium sp.]